MAFAGQSEIVRSHQKDNYFRENFKNRLSTSLSGYLGAKWWMKLHNEILLFADMCYFYFTTGSGCQNQNVGCKYHDDEVDSNGQGFQTLGQEYCNMIHMDQYTFKTPSKKKCQSMILLSHITPYLYRRLLRSFESALQCSEIFYKFHLAIFYLDGKFFELSKRIFGVRDVVIRQFLKELSANSTFRVLGGIMGIQLAFEVYGLVLKTYKGILNFQSLSSVRSNEPQNILLKTSAKATDKCPLMENNSVTCSLCLEKMKHFGATSCGHLFCWNCIIEWSMSKHECPVCRDEFLPSRMTYLRHFEVPKTIPKN